MYDLLLSDIAIESLRACITGAIFVYLFVAGRKSNLESRSGWRFIQTGFGLLFLGSLFDITDNFPSLNAYVIIGNTPYEALIEKIGGYTFGFLCLAIGYWKWLPKVLALQQSKNDLKQSEEEKRAILGAVPDLLFRVRHDGTIIGFHCTDASELYAPPSAFLGRNLSDVLPGHVSAPALDHIRRVHESGARSAFEYELEMRGQTRTYENRVIALVNDEALCVVRDITEQRRAEAKLRHNEEFIRSVLDSVDESFLVIDREFRILSANRVFCDWTGTSAGELGDKRCYNVSHNSSRPCYEDGVECAVKQVFESGMPSKVIFRSLQEDGTLLYLEKKAFPLRNASGEITSAIETIQNITERHLLEAEQLKSQKLEAIGTLAGGIAHDFNNLLQGVFGYLSMTRIKLNDTAAAAAMLDQAEKALNLSVNLTNQLLTFSKGGRPVRRCLNLAPVIRTAAAFALSGSSSECRVTIADDLRKASADEGQIGQVIQNIVINAGQAMPDGGAVEIWAENVELQKDQMPELQEGGSFIRIAVRDQGIGIPSQYLGRIFDPYFTTKQKGSGLGLATSYSIVRNHGGMIEVKSGPAGGSTFVVYLPAAENVGEKELSPEAPAPEARRARILVMDDEDMVREVACELIEALGHEAGQASDGQEALALYQAALSQGRPFDIVILDLTVKGGMGGEAALKALKETAPHVVAMVSSGYADNPVVADYRAYGFAAYLNKPYRIDTLEKKINHLLQGVKSGPGPCA